MLRIFQETEEVCGNDNQTYSSVCALRDVACREKKHLHVEHIGSCGNVEITFKFIYSLGQKYKAPNNLLKGYPVWGEKCNWFCCLYLYID